LDLQDNETSTSTFFKFEKDTDGRMIIKEVPNGYINNYIFENFTADKQLNADNELVPLNAYLTFTPLRYEQVKLSSKTTSNVKTDLRNEYNKKVAKIKADYAKQIKSVAKGRYKNNLEEARDKELSKLKEEYDAELAALGTTDTKADIEKRARVADIITSQLELGAALPEILDKLAEQGYVEKINNSAFFKQSTGRDAIVFNIDGAIVPVYRSSKGTSSKTKGEWYPFFFNAGDWLVKAGADTYKDGYNNPIIKQILDSLNKNYKYDKPIAKVEGNNQQLLSLLPLGGLNLDVSDENNSGIYDFRNYAAIAVILTDWQSKLGNIDVSGYQDYLDGVSSSLIKTNPTLKSDIQSAFNEVSKLFAELAALGATETEDPLVDTLKSVSPAAAEQYENMTYAEKEAFKIAEVAEETKTPKQSTAKLSADTLANKLRGGDYKAISKEEALEIVKELSKAAGLKKTHITQLTSLIDKIYKPLKTSTNVDPNITEVPEAVTNEIELDEVVTKEMEVDPPSLTDIEINTIANKISSINVQTGGRGTQLEDNEEFDGYYKLQQQIEQGETVLASQLKEAEEWFNNSPLSKVFSFREAYNLVNNRNPQSVAQWTRSGIILFKGSNLTDLYHEAFHGFTQAFMTPAQREELYDAVKSKSGTFTTYKGEVKSFSEATDKEAEEYLAEGFRKWMLAGAKKSSLAKYSAVERNFFQKLLDKLKALFGSSTINDVVSGDRANAFIEEIYDKLSIGDFENSGYTFSVDNMNQGFKVLDKTPKAINEETAKNTMSHLTHQQTKLLMDSVDSWISESVLIAMSGLSEQQGIEFFKESISMFVNPGKLTPSQIEEKRLKIAPSLNYGQIAKYLKTEAGRVKAYEDVKMLVGQTFNEVHDRFNELKDKPSRTTTEQIELERLASAANMLWWAWNNFGNLTNFKSNVIDSDGNYKGVMAYHLANSEIFGKVTMDDIDSIDQEEGNSRRPYADRSGNETSLYELAKDKTEIKFLFKTIYRIDPKTGLPLRNELGAPKLMDFKKVWNKVALLLENSSDPTIMYNKLLKFAMSKDKTEMTYAIAQVVNKLGPKGLNKTEFTKPTSIDAENMWTNFWSIFSNTRIALKAMTGSFEMKKGKLEFESRIGSGINANIRVGKEWDSKFQIEPSKYRSVEDGVPVMDLKAIVKEFKPLIDSVKKDLKNIKELDPNTVFKFFDALGIKLTRNEEVIEALINGNADYDIQASYRVLRTLLVSKSDILNSVEGSSAKYFGVAKPSFLEILANDPNIIIQRPSDIFRERRNVNVEVGGEKFVIPTLKGEKANWNELQLIEGQFGSGVPTFMATTADGNTQFEHSLPSTMSVMINDINAVEYYDQFLELPHLRHLHFKHNPSARHYEWLKQMFFLDTADAGNYGKRKVVSGKKVKLVLNNISGAKMDNTDGVASAKADPYTKFILDVHLITQVGLPELMRHSDKSTSYSVTLNIQEPVGEKKTQFKDPTKGALYMANVAFLQDPAAFHYTFHNSHIIPNLAIELERIVRLTKRENEIKEQLKRIREQKKAGLPVDPTPVFDLNFLKEGKKFLSFQGILNNATKEELLEKYTEFVQRELDAGVLEYEIDFNKFLEENKALNGKISGETKNYFNILLGQTELTFAQSGKVVAKNLLDSVRTSLPEAERNGYSDEQLTNALLASYTYNTWTHNIESMNVLYGDPASFKHAKEDFHKRNSGIASTGTGYRTDEGMLDTISSTLGGRKFENKYRKGMSLSERMAYDGTMNTGVMNDKVTRSIYFEEIGYNLYKQTKEKEMRANMSLPESKRKSEKAIDENVKTKLFGATHKNLKIVNESSLKGLVPDRKAIMAKYNKMEEADAQGWISFDAYRILSFSQGEWTAAHERLYNDMLEGKEIDQGKVGIFFPPIKAQYWGPLATESERIDAFHKFQLAPIVPTLAALSPKLKALNEKMMKEGIDYSLFESGSKMGNLTKIELDSNDELTASKDNIYDNVTREITDESFTVNKIFVKYLKNQLKIAPKFKGKISFPTQIRKIIETGLMQNGVPSDFKPNLSAEDRIKQWDSLSEENKLKQSANWQKVINYERSVMNLTRVKRQQLFSQAQLSISPTGEVKGKLENVIKYIKKNLSPDEIADHELDLINVDPHTGQITDLSYSLSSELIESILNTLVIKSIVRQKVSGEALIQVSGAMLESDSQFTEPTEEQIKKYGGTNGLTFYRLEEGGQIIESMKIKIALQGDYVNLLYMDGVAVYRDKVVNGKTVYNREAKVVRELDYNASLNNLNKLIKDEKWLNTGENRKLISTHGVRIPTQSQNADVFAEVYEFLPKEAGNIIILPAEIVAQSGGDFDIDKLTLQFPNISREIMTFGKEAEKSNSFRYSVSLYKSAPSEKLKENYEKYKQTTAEDVILNGEVYEDKTTRRQHLELHKKAFGADIIEKTIADMLEQGEIMTWEEFALSDMEKGAQNDILFSMIDIMQSPSAYINLIRPNGTDILDPLVVEAKEVFRGYRPNISTNDEALEGPIQVSQIYAPIYNLFKHYTNNSAKAGVGIGAIDITYNEIFNRVGMYLTPNNREFIEGLESDSPLLIKAMGLVKEKMILEKRKAEFEKIKNEKQSKGLKLATLKGLKRPLQLSDLKTKEEKAKKDEYFLTEKEKTVKDVIKDELAKLDLELKKFKKETKLDAVDAVSKFVRQTLYLPHNTMTVKDALGKEYADKAISLSHTTDVFGENQISDTLSQLENGWLDAAKDPWIFYLRGNEALAPHILFLVQAGVPINHAIQFISQPIIVDYMETIAKLQSQFGQMMDLGEGVSGVTRNKAKLKAKQLILQKLGYDLSNIEDSKLNQQISRLISLESVLVKPEDGQFSLEQLVGQNKYVYETYNLFDENGNANLQNLDIDYSDKKISEIQRQVLLHFLQISDMQDSIRDVKMATNVDTNPSKSLVSVEAVITKLKEIKRTKTEGDVSSMQKYWRIPSAPIEKMIPTIKTMLEDGTIVDTGNLDESKINSPIGSFYVQPIQKQLWSPLFPLKSNEVINKFIESLGFLEKDKARNETWMKNDEDLLTEFKNSLIPIIFQNEFLTFDTDKLLAIDLEPVTYRDAEVKVEKVIALPASGVVAKFEDGNPIIYFDYNTLYNQYIDKAYSKEGYGGELNMEVLDASMFSSFGEYVKFVFEREYLRAKYADLGGKKTIDNLLKDNAKAKSIFSDTASIVRKGDYANETERTKVRKRLAFEKFITQEALKNTYNLRALFHGENAYVFEIFDIVSDPTYKGLVEEFDILNNIVPDSETSIKGSNRINLAFVESVNDVQTINSYYEQVRMLSNSESLRLLNREKNLFPGLTTQEVKEKLIKVEEVFSKLPIVAFLQSGMSSHGRFSFNRIVDENIVRLMNKDATDRLLNQIELEELSQDPKEKYKTLQTMWDAFTKGNKMYDVRGKNFVIDKSKNGNPVLNLEDIRIINSSLNPDEALFDPEFIQNNGLPSNGFIKLGDVIPFSINFPNNKNPYNYKITVDDIKYEDGYVVVEGVNFNQSRVKLLFNNKGTLINVWTAAYDTNTKTLKEYNVSQKVILTDISVSTYFIKDIIGDQELEYTTAGDTVQGTIYYTTGGKIESRPISFNIDSIEDIGFEYLDGVKRKDAKSRYLVKGSTTYTSGSVVQKTFVLDSSGAIIGEIFKGNFNKSPLGGFLNATLNEERKSPDKESLVFYSQTEIQDAVTQGLIQPGQIVELVSFNSEAPKGLLQSKLYIYDASAGKVSPYSDIYVDFRTKQDDLQELLEKEKKFIVYNGALNPQESIDQTSSSAQPLKTPSKKGIQLKDKFVHYGDFNLKVGVTSRKKYGGGKNAEFFEDEYDYVENKAIPNREAVAAIDSAIETIKLQIAAGYTPVFNQSGYGQYMIGASDDTGKVYKDNFGIEKIGEVGAIETFKYLSNRLLEVGFVNPNFVKEAEGVPAIVAATKQPATEQDIVELMKKCFLL
jgi:uncharacterized protein (DUF1499 family)